MVICMELGADLHMTQLMPLALTVSCFSKIQIGFTFLVPAHLGSPRKRAVKQVCVCGGGDLLTLALSDAAITCIWVPLMIWCAVPSPTVTDTPHSSDYRQ